MNSAATLFLPLALSLLLLSRTVFAYDGPGGLVFRSYETSPDSRTSMSVPSAESRGFVFSRELHVSFDNRIDAERENFGYVCRIILDRSLSVDIILVNHVGAMPQLGIVANCSETPQFFPLEDAIYDWHTIDVSFTCTDGGLDLKANGISLGHIPAGRRRHEARLLFGANSSGRFSTTDAAPAVIDNVRVSEDGSRHEYVWKFTFSENRDIPDSSGTEYARLENPGWVLENNLKWRRIGEMTFPSKVFVATDYRNKVWLVGEDKLVKVSLPSFRSETGTFRNKVNVSMLTNNFIILPGERLAYYDFVSGETPFVMFDSARSEWERPVTREEHSPYLHHSAFFNMADSTVVQMFGYGYHNYSNDMYVCRLHGGSCMKSRINEISPRYLSAVGVRDSLAYIYGGKGNNGGNQELGAVVTNDFWIMNIRDGEVHKVWENPADSSLLAAWNLIVSEDGKRFMGLVYSPNTFRTSLQLTEFSVSDGSCRILGDRIPYFFLDTDSDARLLYDEAGEALYAVTVYKTKENTYKAVFWSIGCPVLSRSDFVGMPDSGRHLLIRYLGYGVAVLLTVFLAVAAIYIVRRRRNNGTCEPDDVGANEEENTVNAVERPPVPGIYLAGGFRVVNAEGQDITSSFSQRLCYLLCLLVLYTESKEGISSSELKDLLWFDKSDEGYRNNRGVYFYRLRLLLESVSQDIKVLSENGVWRIDCDESLCDYFRNMRVLNDTSFSENKVRELVSIARQGTLLPGIQTEWTDSFKSLYDNRILESLCGLRDNPAINSDPKRLIVIADAILGFDSLDEVTVKVKCRALMAQRKFGLAKAVFDKFSKEYAVTMGEEYPRNFTEFVR